MAKQTRYPAALFGLLVILISSLLAFATAEVGFRLAGHQPYTKVPSAHSWAETDPLTGWRNREGVHPADEPGQVPMTFWSDGRRATGAAPPPADDPRPHLAVVGCSFTQGYGIADHETYPWLLAKEFPALRIDNFATGGWGTYQSLLKLEEILASGQRPKLVVYGFTYFHDERNVLTYNHARGVRNAGGARFAPPYVLLDGDAGLKRFEGESIPDWPLERTLSTVAMAHDAYYQSRLRSHFPQAREATLRLLASMKKLTDANGARLLVLILDDTKWKDVGQKMEEMGIDAVSAMLPGYTKAAYKVGGIGHPTGYVHAYWADAARPYIARFSASVR